MEIFDLIFWYIIWLISLMKRQLQKWKQILLTFWKRNGHFFNWSNIFNALVNLSKTVIMNFINEAWKPANEKDFPSSKNYDLICFLDMTWYVSIFYKKERISKWNKTLCKCCSWIFLFPYFLFALKYTFGIWLIFSCKYEKRLLNLLKIF